MGRRDDASSAPTGVRRRRWGRIVAGVAVGLLLVVVAAGIAFDVMWVKGGACTAVGGPVYDVATPDEAFDAWWAEQGPASARAMAALDPDLVAIDPPVRTDLVRDVGGDGRVSWHWSLAGGHRVVVSVDRIATQPGWMVAANRCGRG